MVKKRRTLRKRRTNIASKRSSTRKKKSLKDRFYTSAIWALGLVNVVLIASKVSEFFVSPNATTISATPVQEGQPLAGNDRIVQPPEQIEQLIMVEVLNACGVKGLANKFTDYLRSQGFDVVNVGNYSGGFDLKRTKVLDRTSLSKVNAVKVGEALGVDVTQIQPQLDDSPKLEVTVLLGRDFKKLKSYREIQ